MKFFGFLLLLALLALGGAAYLVYVPVTPPEETFLDLPVGTGTQAMAQKLEEAHIIRSRYAFLILRVWKGGSLKAGEYRFADPASALTVYSRIARGDVYTRAVTIPEGFNLYDIAAAVEAAGLGTHQGFLEAVQKNTDLIADLSPNAQTLEGFLYPDTYRFSRHTTPRTMLDTMVRRFRKEAALLDLKQPTACAGLCTSLAETVTMASLIEKEVHFDDERAQAAGVFINRLNRRMPLQTDPTVVYAAILAGHWTGVIHRSDLDRESPYNTYKRTGLPPAPICSPGAAALKAALHPAETEAMYFVADNTGHTRFASTIGEHNANVADYRKGQQH